MSKRKIEKWKTYHCNSVCSNADDGWMAPPPQAAPLPPPLLRAHDGKMAAAALTTRSDSVFTW